MNIDTVKYLVREVELNLGAELEHPWAGRDKDYDDGVMEGAGIVMNALWKALQRENELLKGANTGMAERYARVSNRLCEAHDIGEE